MGSGQHGLHQQRLSYGNFALRNDSVERQTIGQTLLQPGKRLFQGAGNRSGDPQLQPGAEAQSRERRHTLQPASRRENDQRPYRRRSRIFRQDLVVESAQSFEQHDMGRTLAGLPGSNARLSAFLPALPSSGTTQDRILRHRNSLSAAGTDPLLRSHRPPGGDRPHIGRRTAGCRRRQKLSQSELNRSLHSARRHQSRNFGPSERLVRNHHRRRQKGWMECSTFETI